MGFFGKIPEKLGIGGDKAAATLAPKTGAATAAANPQKLNWRTSIIDLLKLLDIDSSFSARKELATELGCPAELMGDSAKMSMWLHNTVLARVAENGRNVPKELLDRSGAN